MQVSHSAIARVDGDGDGDDLWSCLSRTKVSEDVKHTFAWTIERFSERQEQNSQVGGTAEWMVSGVWSYVMLLLHIPVLVVEQIYHPRSG